jgi:hypothetical protein
MKKLVLMDLLTFPLIQENYAIHKYIPILE